MTVYIENPMSLVIILVGMALCLYASIINVDFVWNYCTKKKIKDVNAMDLLQIPINASLSLLFMFIVMRYGAGLSKLSVFWALLPLLLFISIYIYNISDGLNYLQERHKLLESFVSDTGNQEILVKIQELGDKSILTNKVIVTGVSFLVLFYVAGFYIYALVISRLV